MRMSRTGALRLQAVLAASALAGLLGCATVEVWFGARIRLDRTPMVAMVAELGGGPGIGPGQTLPLLAQFTGPDGTIYLTEGEGQGKVMWRDLKLDPSVVSVDAKGRVSLPADPRLSDGRTGHVALSVPSQPGLKVDLDIPIRYDLAFAKGYAGRKGADGGDGFAGQDGSTGSSGSIDPASPSPGASGGDGTGGSNGGDGGPGGDGPAVTVRVALRSGIRPLLMVRCEGDGQTDRFLVDPAGGSLAVRSQGGPGGRGGRGGAGGRGGSGGSGSPSGNSGSDGSRGWDGTDGRPGRDGPVTVVYDAAAKPFLGAIRAAGAVFREEPVEPVW